MFSFYCFHIFLVKVSNPFFLDWLYTFFWFWVLVKWKKWFYILYFVLVFIFCIWFCFLYILYFILANRLASPIIFYFRIPRFIWSPTNLIFTCHPYDTFVWFLLVLLLSPLLLLLLLLLVVSRPLLFVRTCKTC